MRFTLALLMLALPGLAGTRILDTLLDIRGQRASGQCALTWPAFSSPADARAIAAGTRVYVVRSGVLDLNLEPTPLGVTYSVRCLFANSGAGPLEYWAVPISPTPVTLAQVRVGAPGAPPPGGVTAAPAFRFVDAEQPSGTINGANQAFQLTQPPSPASSLILFRNGLLQTTGVDFSLSGRTVTFVSGATPQVGDVLTAWYRW